MDTFRVNYSYAAPTGALRSSAVIIQAQDADEAINTTRAMLIGKLKFLKVQSATLYNADQIELPLKVKKS